METKYLIEKLSEKYDSFYLYDEQSIVSQINLLKTNFPSVNFLYSLKCNPDKNILSSVFSKKIGAAVSSVDEVDLAYNFGLNADDIFYSAPGKSMDDLQNAFSKSIIIADSISEIEQLKKLAEISGQQIEVGIRINPEFTFEKDGGLSSRFGIDEKDAINYISQLDELYVKVVGIYTHIKNQELDCSKINRFHKKVFQLAERVEYEIGRKLKFINLGSGIGIPYSETDKEFNIEWLGKEMEERISNFRVQHPKTKIIMELGRYIVGKCGTYVTHVVDKKKSHGKTYVVLKNILNGFIRPVISFMVQNYSSQNNPDSFEPLFTKINSFGIEVMNPNQNYEEVTLVGDLPIQADMLAKNIKLPILKIGDVVMISNAGSYAAVFSPMQFSLKKKPSQIFFTVDGEIRESN